MAEKTVFEKNFRQKQVKIFLIRKSTKKIGIKNSRLENWLEKLQSEYGEKIGIVDEKVSSWKIGAKNSSQKMDGTI